jgi:ACS family pantothenate transporter-like MFS transporter
LTWINEICSDDTEKRALLIAMGNDLAYVVQAVVSHDLLNHCLWETELTNQGPQLCLEDNRLPSS